MAVTKEDLEQLLVAEIRRLSQELGLFDDEIASDMGLSRATVNRKRQKYNIPRANLSARQDKAFACYRCGDRIIIRRSDRKYKYCGRCKPVVGQENRNRRQLRAHQAETSV